MVIITFEGMEGRESFDLECSEKKATAILKFALKDL